MKIPRVVKTYVETWSTGDMDTCVALFAPDGTYSDPTLPEPTVARSLKEHFAGFFTGFPDIKFETVGLDAISITSGYGGGLGAERIPAPCEVYPRQDVAWRSPDASSSKFAMAVFVA